LGRCAIRLPYSPRPKPLAASPRLAGRALYTHIGGEIKESCAPVAREA
jgi:hypothetical protein